MRHCARWVLVPLVLWLVAIAACGGGSRAAGTDAGVRDASFDASTADDGAAPDAGTDAARDALADSTIDVSTADAANDAAVDSPPDAVPVTDANDLDGAASNDAGALTKIVVNGPSTFDAGTPTPFTATGTFADGSSRDITLEVTWSIQLVADTVATIDANGVVTGIVPGTALVRAAAQNQIGAILINVTDAIVDLYVQVYRSALSAGENCTLMVAPDLPPEGTADWDEAPAPTAAWDLVGAQAKGFDTFVRAVGKRASAPTVWIDVTPLVAFTTIDPSATGTTVDPTGRVHAGAPGTVQVVATVVSSGHASAPRIGTSRENGTLTIEDYTALASLAINPERVTDRASPRFGSDPVYVATGASSPIGVVAVLSGAPHGGYCVTVNSTLTSNKTTVASVDATGVVTGVTKGTATVTARVLTTASDTIPVNVGAAEIEYVEITPSAASMTTDANASAQLHAILHYTDGTTPDVSSDPSVQWYVGAGDGAASVSATGLVRPNATATPGSMDQIGACYPSVLVAADGTTSTLTACSDETSALQTAPPALDPSTGTLYDLNATITFH